MIFPEKAVKAIVRDFSAILKDNLTGIYVHGSAAFGCFNPRLSDLDIIVVVYKPLQKHIKLDLLKSLERNRFLFPGKGVEMSVVLYRHCRHFVYPTPYELHYSQAHEADYLLSRDKYCDDSCGVDYDLAAHFTVIGCAGIVAYGKKASEVFSAVPEECFSDSIKRDIVSAGGGIVENPVYYILNMCRTLMFLNEKTVGSKADGGVWAMKILPNRYRSVVAAALESYRNGAEFTVDSIRCLDFEAYMKTAIFGAEDRGL